MNLTIIFLEFDSSMCIKNLFKFYRSYFKIFYNVVTGLGFKVFILTQYSSFNKNIISHIKLWPCSSIWT